MGAWSDTSESQVIELKFITIDVAPWAYLNEQTNEPEGAFIEIVRELEKRTSLSISTTLSPFARVDRELESGDHDCTILVPLESESITRGEVVVGHDIGVISHRDMPLSSAEDLKGKRISLLRGTSITQALDTDIDLQLEYDTDYLIALRKLDRRRIDGIAGAMPTMLYLAEQNEMTDMLAPPLGLADVPLVLQCSVHSEHINLMPQLNEAVQAIKADGTLQAISDQYFF